VGVVTGVEFSSVFVCVVMGAARRMVGTERAFAPAVAGEMFDCSLECVATRAAGLAGTTKEARELEVMDMSEVSGATKPSRMLEGAVSGAGIGVAKASLALESSIAELVEVALLFATEAKGRRFPSNKAFIVGMGVPRRRWSE
jgi:hypothetical protein